MTRFEKTHPSIDVADITKLEEQFEINFPDEYRNHLLRYNGGMPKPDIFSFVEDGKNTDSRVSFFYGIKSGDYDDLLDALLVFKGDHKRMPSQIIPIAEDAFGNVICVSSGDRDYGHVYFWDHEREVNYNLSNDNDYSNLYFIAVDINTFLTNLRVQV